MGERPAIPPLGNPMFAGMVPALKAFDPKLVENFWYDSGRQRYIYQTGDGNFINLALADVKRRLKKIGISAKRDPLTELSAIDDCLLFVQDFQSVQYAGALAGHKCGMIEMNEIRILITSEAKSFEIVEGDFGVLLDFLDGLLGHDPKQIETFIFWLLGIIFEREKPREVLVLAGDAGGGKSLLQQLITKILGGRSAKPYSYLTHRTDFNADLFGAEHLVIDDEAASTDYRSRESLGNHLKQIVTGTEHRLHAKGSNALMLSPFWVCSISLNLETENLRVLPRMERSLEDKILLLKAAKVPLPMPTETAEQRTAFWNELVSGASALLWELKNMEIPRGLTSERYVVRAYHHPELLRALSNISKEAELLELIEANIQIPFRGTASKLDGQLRLVAPQQTQQLFSFPNACAVLLGRLQKLYPDRIEKCRSRNAREWLISDGRAEGEEG